MSIRSETGLCMYEGSESRCRSHRAGGAAHCIAGAVQRDGVSALDFVMGCREGENFPLFVEMMINWR